MISTVLKNACGSLLNLYAVEVEHAVSCVVYIHYLPNRRNGALPCETVKAAQDYPDAMAGNLPELNYIYWIIYKDKSGNHFIGEIFAETPKTSFRSFIDDHLDNYHICLYYYSFTK